MVATLAGTQTIQGNVLRIHGEGHVLAEEVSQFISDLCYAYNCLYVFESIGQGTDAEQAGEDVSVFAAASRAPFSSFWMTAWPPTPEKVAALVPADQKLQLQAVEIHSPGFWDFFGKLNPLEVIRLFLNDRHERLKDRDYRNAAEERKLFLENAALENKVLNERLAILRDAGATPDQIQSIVEQLVYAPLKQLQSAQDYRLIEGAEIIASDAEKKKRF